MKSAFKQSASSLLPDAQLLLKKQPETNLHDLRQLWQLLQGWCRASILQPSGHTHTHTIQHSHWVRTKLFGLIFHLCYYNTQAVCSFYLRILVPAAREYELRCENSARPTTTGTSDRHEHHTHEARDLSWKFWFISSVLLIAVAAFSLLSQTDM